MMSKISKNRRPSRSCPSTIDGFFPAKKKAKTLKTKVSKPTSQSPYNSQAALWGERLQTNPEYLTPDGKSWFLFVKRWMPTPSSGVFEKEWDLHPQSRHELKVFGRTVLEKRWSQSWGISYNYSGATNQARPIAESIMLPDLIGKVNALTQDKTGEGNTTHYSPYNGCLQNWYLPEDTIGFHADDERIMDRNYPIFSLSWGGTRRFLFQAKTPNTSTTTKNDEKSNSRDRVEIWLEDGDLLVMGGACQETHKHGIPKIRKTKDPRSSNRINWTIRAFVTP